MFGLRYGSVRPWLFRLVPPGRRFHGVSVFFLVLFLGIAGAGADSGRAPLLSGLSHAPMFDPPDGVTRTYQITSSGTLSMDYSEWARAFSPPGGQVPPTSQQVMAEHSYEVRADLHLRVTGTEEGRITAAGRFQNVIYEVDSQTDVPPQIFEVPFVLTYRQDGRLESMHLPAPYPEALKGILRSLVEPMQVVFPEARQAGWQYQTRDSQGESKLACRVVGLEGGGQKLRLSRTLVASNPNHTAFSGTHTLHSSGMTSRVVRSQGEIVWSMKDNLLESISFEDHVTTQNGPKLFADHTRAFSATLSRTPTPSLPATTQQAHAALLDPAAMRLAHYWVPGDVRRKVDEITLESVIQAVEKREEFDGLKPTVAMKYFLRLNPSLARAVAEHFNRYEFTQENMALAAKAFSAIGAAGHQEAQQVLADAISGRGFSPMSQDRALRATLSIPYPDASLLPVVWTYRESLPRSGQGWKQGVSIATNIYGALGGVEHMNPAMTREVVSVLGARLANAPDETEALFCLVALGNVGDLNQVLPYTAKYFSHANPTLRRRAFHTYQKALGDQAFTQFAERFRAEQDLSVRRTASSIAEVIPPSAARNQWATELAFEIQDDLILGRLVQILGNEMGQYPENEQTLRRLLDRVESREVRKTIYRYIAPASTQN